MVLLSYVSIPIITRNNVTYLRLDLNTNYLYYKKNNDYVLIEDLYQYAQEIANSMHDNFENEISLNSNSASDDDECCCGHDHNEIQDPEYILKMLKNQIMNNNISEDDKKNLQNIINNIENLVVSN
jgi:hypothetical protein